VNKLKYKIYSNLLTNIWVILFFFEIDFRQTHFQPLLNRFHILSRTDKEEAMRTDYCPECGHLLSRKGIFCRFCGNCVNPLVLFKTDTIDEIFEPTLETSGITHIENYVFDSDPEKFEEA
jgi:hypothetical protein